MRHRVSSHQFGRSTKPRQALLKGLVRSLLERGSITTSKEKAKETKRLTDKLIGKAQTDSISTRRQLHRFFGKRDVVNTLVERVAPAMKDRHSGFTKSTHLGRRRGDNAEMVKLELVARHEAAVAGFKNPTPRVPKVTAAAAKPASKPTAKKAVAKKTTAKKPAKTGAAK